MRVLGLDLGTRRIGLALSDPDARLAFPRDALERRGREQDLAALAAFAREHEVGRIVVGLPIHMDGRAGTGARAARELAAALAARTGLPVDTLDERWTIVEAERVVRETRGRRGRRRRRERGEVDGVAAAILLRTYLELQRGRASGAEPPKAERP